MCFTIFIEYFNFLWPSSLFAVTLFISTYTEISNTYYFSSSYCFSLIFCWSNRINTCDFLPLVIFHPHFFSISFHPSIIAVLMISDHYSPWLPISKLEYNRYPCYFFLDFLPLLGDQGKTIVTIHPQLFAISNTPFFSFWRKSFRSVCHFLHSYLNLML